METRNDPDGLHEVTAGLARLARRLDAAATGVSGLRRISGGASQEIWGFVLDGPGTPLILRRAPRIVRHGVGGVGPEMEAVLMSRAAAAGAPVPRIIARLEPEDRLGAGYIMAHVEGETLPKRILRADEYAPARAAFAEDTGRALAAIHRADLSGLDLRTIPTDEAVEHLADRHRAIGHVRPVFELALVHLARTIPASADAPCLVHGDFRLGNLIIGPEGLSAVLDWELAFRGDRHADFGWLCMESWRFGGTNPVGGIARRADLFAAYEAAGGCPVDRAAVAWWEVWSALRWGIITTEMGVWVRDGSDRSVERQVIARRASETELILMAHLTGRTG